jgi:hypothetical protein
VRNKWRDQASGIILEKMGCMEKGWYRDDKDQKMKTSKRRGCIEESVEEKPVVVAAAQNTNDEEKPVEKQKIGSCGQISRRTG